MPSIETFYDGLINLHGTNIIFGNAGIGKSAFCVYLMNELAMTGKRVCFFDFELSEIQFNQRYQSAVFSDNLYFANVEGLEKPLEAVIATIEAHSEDIDIFVIDNITYIHDNLTDPQEGTKFMKQFSELIKKRNKVAFVLAHTPKGYEGAPLDQSSLAGAKALSNFASDIIGLGKSYNEASFGNVIYLKHVKTRNGQTIYHDRHVMLREFRGMMDFPAYESGIGEESNHVKKKFREIGELNATDTKKVVVRFLTERGYSRREINEMTGISERSIARYRT